MVERRPVPERQLPPARIAVVRRLADDPGVALGRRLREMAVGSPGTIAGAVYGTIVALAAVTAGGKAFQDDLWHLSAIVAITVLVLWVAHVYAHGLAESIELGRRLGATELRELARRELAIPLAAVAPCVVLVIGAAGVMDGGTAVWLAVAVGVVTLAVQGIRYARLERLSPTGVLVSVSLNVALGLTIVVLKVLVGH
jgi:hypothetical protein